LFLDYLLEEEMYVRNMRRLILALACLPALLSVTGCSTKPMYGAVKFDTEPSGAEVVNLKDDASLGITPVVVTWESEDGKPEYVTVQMKKAGYLEKITSFWVNTRHGSRAEAQEEAQPISADLQRRN
jgi:hypothetical protein